MINIHIALQSDCTISKNVITHLLELVLVAVHDPDSQDELLGVVVVEDTVEIISKTCRDREKTVSILFWEVKHISFLIK